MSTDKLMSILEKVSDELRNFRDDVLENRELKDVLTRLGGNLGDAWKFVREDHKSPAFNERCLVDDGESMIIDRKSWSVFSGDIDDFKRMNSQLGYDEADSVLRIVGEKLINVASRADGKVYRRGGDEFVIAAPSVMEERIAQSLASLFPIELKIKDQKVRVSMSFGYTNVDKNAPFEDSRKRADDASKAAKWQTEARASVIKWRSDLEFGEYPRFRCNACNTQYSLGIPPGVGNCKLAHSRCLICNELVGEPEPTSDLTTATDSATEEQPSLLVDN